MYYHLKEFFPECAEIILYEAPLIGNRSDYGTADFICRTNDNNIVLIELKFIDNESSGPTARVRRRKHRQKVVNQVQKWKRRIMTFYNVPEDKILSRIFTTDSLVLRRAKRVGVSGNYISILELRNWLSHMNGLELDN